MSCFGNFALSSSFRRINPCRTSLQSDLRANMSTKMQSPTLHPELASVLQDIRVTRNFNAKQWIHEKCTLFNNYMQSNGLKGAVLNLSGGVDSAVTLGLLKHASRMPFSPLRRILAVAQPIHSSSWAFNRAKEAADVFETELVTIDQTEIYDRLKALIDYKVGNGPGNAFVGGQLRSYMRTPAVYYVAQLLSTNESTPAVVMGTGNKDEDGYLAYFCKAGDGVVDVQLISDLHKSEVFHVGAVLGVPNSILSAAPSADLWNGQTDEDELGFSYDFIELWTTFIEFDSEKQNRIRNKLSDDAKQQLKQWGDKAMEVHRRNKHKIDSPHNIISSKL
eukprot:822775_1